MSVRPSRVPLLVAALLTIVRPLFAQELQNDVLEEYAFSVGLQAYLYGYPLVITEISRRGMLAEPGVKVNQFHRFPHLLTPALKSAVSANVNTLLSTAWLDFSNGQLMLHVPDMQGDLQRVSLGEICGECD